MPPQGLFLVLILTCLPLLSAVVLGGPLATLSERTIRDGLRLCSVAAVRVCCCCCRHGGTKAFVSALASQKGQMAAEIRCIVMDS